MIAEYKQTPFEMHPVTISSISNGFFWSRNEIRQIIKVTKAWREVKNKNPMKYLIFLRPTHVPTQGQWWSCTSTHTPHELQWNERGGLRILQV